VATVVLMPCAWPYCWKVNHLSGPVPPCVLLRVRHKVLSGPGCGNRFTLPDDLGPLPPPDTTTGTSHTRCPYTPLLSGWRDPPPCQHGYPLHHRLIPLCLWSLAGGQGEDVEGDGGEDEGLELSLRWCGLVGPLTKGLGQLHALNLTRLDMAHNQLQVREREDSHGGADDEDGQTRLVVECGSACVLPSEDDKTCCRCWWRWW
jgi:hypothetical protein